MARCSAQPGETLSSIESNKLTTGLHCVGALLPGLAYVGGGARCCIKLCNLGNVAA